MSGETCCLSREQERADFFCVHSAVADSLSSLVVADWFPLVTCFRCSRSHVKYDVENKGKNKAF